MEFNTDDITGKVYGELTVINFSHAEPHKKLKHFKYLYLCKCSCGKEKKVVRTNLITGHTTSCGCKKRRNRSASKTWSGFGQISGRTWYKIKRHAISRKLEFDISIEDAWRQFEKQNGRCALSGLPIHLNNFKLDGKYTWHTASLDRIDSTKGYRPNNIQWIHKNINIMKNSLPEDMFVGYCRLITDRLVSNCSMDVLENGYNLWKSYRVAISS
jgi:hypothetical protein